MANNLHCQAEVASLEVLTQILDSDELRVLDEPGNPAVDKGYGALHIRRNEFQFKTSWAPVKTIFENTKALFKPGQRLYISTDELGDDGSKTNGRAYFQEFLDRYDVKFLVDLAPIKDRQAFPRQFTGMVEQLICTHADVFVGTKLSTFTGYIHQMRGYMRTAKNPGAPHGAPWINTAVHWTTTRYSKLLVDEDENKETKVNSFDSKAIGAWGRSYYNAWHGVGEWAA